MENDTIQHRNSHFSKLKIEKIDDMKKILDKHYIYSKNEMSWIVKDGKIHNWFIFDIYNEQIKSLTFDTATILVNESFCGFDWEFMFELSDKIVVSDYISYKRVSTDFNSLKNSIIKHFEFNINQLEKDKKDYLKTIKNIKKQKLVNK